jgi:cardiolipin synthase (CMP-forming)
MKYISNVLTFIRLLLVPLFPLAFFSSHPQGRLIALGIFVIAGFTDFLDGYIARRFHTITQLGTLLDPLADKLMLLMVLVTLWINGTLPVWIVVILILKETFMIVAGAYLYLRKGKFVIPSNYFGKSATALLFLAIPLRMLLPDNPIGLVLMAVALGLMLTALVSYTRFYWRRREHL